ncbi:MAG: sensor histidine kinase [Gallicola sp.]|nr:sensor histidine kinase [Gallicola sp.]
MEVIESLRKDLMEGDSIKDRKLRELKDYYSLWAHQIKLPISAAYLLLEGSEINPSEIKSEVFRIEEYVNSLLAYLQLDSSQTDYVFGEMELDEIVRSSIRRYASLFIRKGIKVDFKPSNKKIISDKKWLGFILNQILSNALKYTEKGMIEIFWKEGSLYIRDSGIGIPYEDLPRIYQRGFTGVNGRGRNNSTGIGLALCKQIGEELHIQIKIESVREGGTTVILTFRE